MAGEERATEDQGHVVEVRRGDTLWKIAQRAQNEGHYPAETPVPKIVDTISRLNDLQDPDRLSVGQTLRVTNPPPPPTISAEDIGKAVIRLAGTARDSASQLVSRFNPASQTVPPAPPEPQETTPPAHTINPDTIDTLHNLLGAPRLSRQNTRTVQELLSGLDDSRYDPQGVDGIAGPNTRGAIRNFLADHPMNDNKPSAISTLLTNAERIAAPKRAQLALLAAVPAIATHFKMQPEDLYRVLYIESSLGQNRNTSAGGAVGPAQFIKGTWEGYSRRATTQARFDTFLDKNPQLAALVTDQEREDFRKGRWEASDPQRWGPTMAHHPVLAGFMAADYLTSRPGKTMAEKYFAYQNGAGTAGHVQRTLGNPKPAIQTTTSPAIKRALQINGYAGLPSRNILQRIEDKWNTAGREMRPLLRRLIAQIPEEIRPTLDGRSRSTFAAQIAQEPAKTKTGVPDAEKAFQDAATPKPDPQTTVDTPAVDRTADPAKTNATLPSDTPVKTAETIIPSFGFNNR